MLGWQVKAIAAALVVAAITALIARDHIRTKRLNQYKRDVATLTQTIEAERQARATEQADRRQADATITQLNADLADLRSTPPITGVRCRTARPSVPGEGGGAAATDGAGTGAVAGLPREPAGGDGPFGPELDVSAGVDWYASKCAEQAVMWARMQEWDRARSH